MVGRGLRAFGPVAVDPRGEAGAEGTRGCD